MAAVLGGLLDDVAVAQREGVAVHHQRTHRAVPFIAGDGGEELLQAVGSVLHQQHLPGLGHGVEEEALQQEAVGGLGAQEQVLRPGLEGVPAQLRQHRGRQILALIGWVHRQILQQRTAARAGGGQRVAVPHQHRYLRGVLRTQIRFFQQLRPRSGQRRLPRLQTLDVHSASEGMICLLLYRKFPLLKRVL